MTSTVPDPELLDSERVQSNLAWGEATPKLSILVPTYQDDPSPLLNGLTECDRMDEVELVLYDDGSVDTALVSKIERMLAAVPLPSRVIRNTVNNGRAFARNRLCAFARSPWLLFLDADMQPDAQDFLSTYLDLIEVASGPSVCVGGFSLKHTRPTPAVRLHWAQCETSECVSATERRKAPGRYTFTSNLLVHRDVLKAVPFDTGFEGWGWEDVEWGLRVEQHYGVRHIDNTASHLGLDTAAGLIRKYGTSGENFARLISLHPHQMRQTPLYRSARLLGGLPVTGAVQRFTKWIALAPGWLLPSKLRLLGLKLYRASVYGRSLRHG